MGWSKSEFYSYQAVNQLLTCLRVNLLSQVEVIRHKYKNTPTINSHHSRQLKERTSQEIVSIHEYGRIELRKRSSSVYWQVLNRLWHGRPILRTCLIKNTSSTDLISQWIGCWQQYEHLSKTVWRWNMNGKNKRLWVYKQASELRTVEQGSGDSSLLEVGTPSMSSISSVMS